MKPFEIKKNVYWVGAIDWLERDFHGFEIPEGTTYNAYLIVDDRITLIDTVKQKFYDEMMQRIEKIIDPAKIEYIISNHIETDHSGSLGDIKDIAKDAVIVCTSKGKNGLCKHFDCDKWDFWVVRTGDELKIGKRILKFLETPMIHWPDSMMTYNTTDKILFSSDAFGQHIASTERYDDGIGVENAVKLAKVYYANIMMPFGALIRRKLREIEELKIDAEMIAPSHGVIWKDKEKIVRIYREWSEFKSEDKLVIVYDTMWGSTERIARAISEGASLKVKVKVFHSRKDAWSKIMTEILDAKAVAIGSPTMHSSVFPPIAGFLTYMVGLKPKNKIGLAFGSYGWGGGAVRDINAIFEKLKFEIIEPLQIKYRPMKEEIEKAYEVGERLAEKIKES